MSAPSPRRSPSAWRPAAPRRSPCIRAGISRPHAPRRFSRTRARRNSSPTICRISPSSAPPRRAGLRWWGSCCRTTPCARTAFTAGSSRRKSGAANAGTSAVTGAGSFIFAATRAAALLLVFGGVAGALLVLDVLVRHAERLAVRGRGDVDLVRHLAGAIVRLLHRVGVEFLQRHQRVARIAVHRVLLAIELRVVALTVPVRAELGVSHLVHDRGRGVVGIADLVWLPGAG